jgi:hypothetical protein
MHRAAALADPTKAEMVRLAVKRLVRAKGSRQLATAVQDYDFLSNMCHHNGSGDQLYHRSMRVTDQIMLPWGDRAVFTKPGPAVTLSYPPMNAIRASLVQTASAMPAYCAWSEAILQKLPVMPFSEEEVQKLTAGKIKNSLNFFVPKNQNERDRFVKANTIKPGRNHPCFCGSGKKYKNCCLRYTA